MKGKRFTDEQITYALRQAEGGTPVAADSGRCRPLIPRHAGPAFRAMSGHRSGASRHRV
jgi:hypothetical protein